MSWKASAWAKEQRLGSPSAKSILMCLADYADPDGIIKGWASQSELSASAEVSERTAREWLQRLEEWGLVERQRQQRPNGARAADWIVLRLDRTVTDGAERVRATKIEGDAEDGLPAESAGRTYRQPDAEPTGNQTHPTGNQFRAYKDKPPIEPPLPSQEARAEAREREGEIEDRKKIEAEGWALLKDWPGFAGMPKEPAFREWMKLDADSRRLARERFAGWLGLLKAQGKSHVPAPSTYLRERLFDDVPDAPPAPFNEFATPFSKAWSAWIVAHCLTAEGEREKGWPLVSLLYRKAQQRRGHDFAKRWHDLGASFVAVPVGSAMASEWEEAFERMGWPWFPDPGDHPVFHLPPDGPAGLHAFEAAIRNEAKDHDGGGREAAE